MPTLCLITVLDAGNTLGKIDRKLVPLDWVTDNNHVEWINHILGSTTYYEKEKLRI